MIRFYRLVKYEHDKELKMTVQEQNKTKPEKNRKNTERNGQTISIHLYKWKIANINKSFLGSALEKNIMCEVAAKELMIPTTSLII